MRQDDTGPNLNNGPPQSDEAKSAGEAAIPAETTAGRAAQEATQKASEIAAETAASDAALVARCQAGDTGAFGELVTQYRNKVFATIYNVTRNEQDAWDLSQEAFVKAWRNIASFKGQSSFFTWLYRIAMNVTIDRLRRKQVESGLEFDETLGLGEIEPGSATTPRSAPAPSENLQNQELRARIDAAIAKLPPDHRLVIILREIDGLSYEEIAQAAKCSVGTVMSRLFYARKKLQTLLHDVYEAI